MGLTNSTDLPTVGALQPFRGSYHNVFIARIAPSGFGSVPKIASASVSGKELFVFGENFNDRAVIMVDGDAKTTSNDLANPTGTLIAKKAGKRIAVGQNAIIQVRNSDGTLSEPFSFVRPSR